MDQIYKKKRRSSGPPGPGSNLGPGPPHSVVLGAADHTVILYKQYNNFEFSDSPYDNPSINCTYLDENEFASRPVTCQYFLSIFKVFPLNFLNYHNLYTI